jgi:hypothetical protein
LRPCADLLDGGGDGAGELFGDIRHLQPDDLQLVGRRGKIDEEVQTAALEPIGELAGVVRGEDDERDVLGPDGPELLHRHLEVREHLEQEGLELGLGLVDLVDEQDDRLIGLSPGSGRGGTETRRTRPPGRRSSRLEGA